MFSLELNKKLLLTTAIAIGSIFTTTSTPATAGSLYQFTFENLTTNDDGNYFSPVTLIFQDDSFDIFEIGAPASFGIQNQAELGAGAQLLMEANDAGFDGVIFASGDTGEPDFLIPDIFPGEIASTIVELDPTDPSQQYLNFAAMFLPSNDAFTGSDSPLQLFDDEGNLLITEILIDTVYDAGTEVNDQEAPNAPVGRRDATDIDPVAPFGLAFNPVTSSPGNVNGGGLSEFGTVQLHPGYINGGLFTEAGTVNTLTFTSPTAFTNPIAVITIEKVVVPEPKSIVSLFAVAGLFVFNRRIRSKN